MLLESTQHGDAIFLTLTYDDEHLPQWGSLYPKHHTLFMKRLRKATGLNIRYFMCGEYGEREGRPHYHYALFGVSRKLGPMILKAWGMGNIFIGDLSEKSAQYVAKYVTKGMNRKKDKWVIDRLEKEKKQPEFQRMSLKPALGLGAIKPIVDFVGTDDGVNYLLKSGDVPDTLMFGRTKLPLGRYLRKKIREESGLDEEKIKMKRMREWALEVNEVIEKERAKNKKKDLDKITYLQKAFRQRHINAEARYQIISSKRGMKL